MFPMAYVEATQDICERVSFSPSCSDVICSVKTPVNDKHAPMLKPIVESDRAVTTCRQTSTTFTAKLEAD